MKLKRIYILILYKYIHISQWVQGHLMDNAQLLQQQQQLKQPPPLHSRVEGVKLLLDRNKGGLGVGGKRSKESPSFNRTAHFPLLAFSFISLSLLRLSYLSFSFHFSLFLSSLSLYQFFSLSLYQHQHLFGCCASQRHTQYID